MNRNMYIIAAPNMFSGDPLTTNQAIALHWIATPMTPFQTLFSTTTTKITISWANARVKLHFQVHFGVASEKNC